MKQLLAVHGSTVIHEPRTQSGLLSLNTATVREKWSLRQMIEGCARHGIRGISPWRDKLAELGAKEAAKLIRAHGLTVTGLCAAHVPAADRQGRKAAIDDNLRAIEDAPRWKRSAWCWWWRHARRSKDLAGARMQVRDGIARYSTPRVRRALAIEPLHPMYAADRACINTMAQANDLCDALVGKGGTGLGIGSTSTTSGGIRS